MQGSSPAKIALLAVPGHQFQRCDLDNVIYPLVRMLLLVNPVAKPWLVSSTDQ
jgi:hypothetical protein